MKFTKLMKNHLRKNEILKLYISILNYTFIYKLIKFTIILPNFSYHCKCKHICKI
jgi:hypothetical protein